MRVKNFTFCRLIESMNQTSTQSVNSGYRQTGLLAGLLISLAIAVALVFWSRDLPLSFFDGPVSHEDTAEIMELLDAEGIRYHVESDSGKIMVPIDQMAAVNRQLSAQRLPGRYGFNGVSEKGSGLDDGKNAEMIRMRKTLERDIARSIMTIQAIEAARVLLAFPEQSEPIQASGKPSASVMLTLKQGEILDRHQIKAVLALVAASVPKLGQEQVALIDQRGQLLSGNDSLRASGLNAREFDYKQTFEDQVRERVVNSLRPLVGIDGLRVQVSADLDFSGWDSSPKKSQNSNSQSMPANLMVLSAGQTVLPNQAGLTEASAQSASTKLAGRRTARKQTRQNNATERVNQIKAFLKRLSVAVAINDQNIIQANGTVKTQPFSQAELDRFSVLAKQAAGFDSSRGDQFAITRFAFKTPLESAALVQLPFWKQAWFFIGLKQVTAALALLLLFFGIARPLVRNLTLRDKAAGDNGNLDIKRPNDKGVSLPQPDDPLQAIVNMPNDLMAILSLDTPQSYPHRLEYLKELVDTDPKLIAEIIKSWVKKDG